MPNLSAPPSTPARRFGKLKGILRSLPWHDIGVAVAVSTIGFSQILFALILENLDYFPREVWFHTGVLLWGGLIPFVLLLVPDLSLARLTRRGSAFWVWRALLCTFLFASVLRQTQIYYPRPFNWILASLPPRPLLVSILALVFLLCIRFRAVINRYVAVLGLLAATLSASYMQRSGLLGPLWDSSWTPAKAAPSGWEGNPVYILVFDELSSDLLMKDGRFDKETFPNFATLAAESAWFPLATTNHLFTVNAFPCMMTGKLYPRGGDLKLFDFLPPDFRVKARTYHPPTYGWMRKHSRPHQSFTLRGLSEEPLMDFLQIPSALKGLISLTPYACSPFNMAPATRILPPLMRHDTHDFGNQRDIEQFLNSVNGKNAEGSLTFWHTHIPHAPFLFDSDGSRHHESWTEFIRTSELKKQGTPAGYLPELVLSNYRKQIRFADHILGRFLDRLKQAGIYDRSTVVVTSDHGLRTWGALEPFDYPERIGGIAGRIPLLIRTPGILPGPRMVEYQHIDFTPTLLDVMGIPWNEEDFEGVSAFSKPFPQRPLRLYDDLERCFRFNQEKDLWEPVRSP